MSFNLQNLSPMSKFVFYLRVKPFIGQWLTTHYGNPVVFPRRSAENACIRRFIGLRPRTANGENVADVPPSSDPSVMVLPIVIPESKRKKTICWNYMSKSAQEALIEIIDDTFKLQMWNDLNEMTRCGCTLLKCVRTWCENNGVDTDYDYTLKMRYQRMRDSYLAHGVDLRKRPKGKNKE